MSGPSIPETFATFGWEITPEWVEKYNTDAWVYNLTNALVNEHHRYLELLKRVDPAALDGYQPGEWNGPAALPDSGRPSDG